MPRKTKVIAFSVPPALYQEVIFLSQSLGKTKSELFRDMVHLYRRFKEIEKEEDINNINRIISEAKQKTVPIDEDWKRFKEIQSYGLNRAKSLNINSEEELERYIDERRENESGI